MSQRHPTTGGVGGQTMTQPQRNNSLHIAFCSYHFYNVTASGQSAAKTARALTDAGHRVTVLTACNNWFESERTAPREGPLEGIVIHRVASDPEATPAWWRALDRQAARGWWWDKLAAVPNVIHGSNVRQWAWVAAACRRFDAVAAAEGPFDLLLTRLNPASSHLVGLRVARRTGLPWCAYFSDPFPFYHYPPPYGSSDGPVLRWRLDRLMGRFLAVAGSALFPSSYLRDLQLVGPRRRFRDKAVLVPHLGNVWHRPRPARRGDRLRIRHAGFLMKERRVEPLLAALRTVLERRPALRGQLRIEFIGRYESMALPEAPDDLRQAVSFHSFRRPGELWGWLQDADALLLVEAPMETGIFFPSKLADYLGAERPILALSPARGVAADLLAPSGVLAPPDDPAAIARALDTVADAWLDDRLADYLPSAEQAALVAPENVVACYERAFAMARNGGAGT